MVNENALRETLVLAFEHLKQQDETIESLRKRRFCTVLTSGREYGMQ
jgi:copper homeostasis protein CutC